MLQKQCVIGVEKKIFETMKRIGGFDREREKWCEEREKISFLEKLRSWEEKGQIYRKNFKTRWRKIRASMKSEVKFGTEK